MLDYLQVAPPPPPSVKTNQTIKILCFVMTKSDFHNTRVWGVKRSWGKKCDKLVIASDKDDPLVGSIAMKSEASYQNLWHKLNETTHYVYDNYAEQHQYEWFVKADDDTYFIMENLQAFLNQPSIQEKHNAGEPLIFGRRYSWVLADQLRSGKRPFQAFFNGTNATQENQDFGSRFYRKFTENPPILYNHGGAGYVMNRSYLQNFLTAMQSPDTLTGLVDEDLAHGAVMAYWDILPQSTVDAQGKQYFHPEPPRYMYGTELRLLRRLTGGNIPSEPVRNGTDCCSRYSISFHHVTAKQMIHLDQIMSTCRQQEELPNE
jgi:glycoprotein-N-acetylgalactosamine 3-beta-galactosyltransferase